MPRAKDSSRGATERETMENIEWARAQAEKATDPSKLTALGQGFFKAKKRSKH